MENKPLSRADVLRITREQCLVPAHYAGSCRYWTPKGDRCAIGMCLPLETAQSLSDCTSKASKIFETIRFAFDETITPEFLDAVQKCHDNAALLIDSDQREEARKVGTPENLVWREDFLLNLDKLEGLR